MNCPQCQSPIKENQPFCPVCGAKLDKSTTGAPLGPLPKLDLPPPPIPQQLKSDPPQNKSAGSPIEKPVPNAPTPESTPLVGESEPEYAAPACNECGQVLNQLARFCPRCGAPVPKIQPTDTPELPLPVASPPRSDELSSPPVPVVPVPVIPASQAEIILGVIPNGVLFKGFSQDIFHLLVTNRRILFAHQTNKMIKQSLQKLKEQAKRSGEELPSEVYEDWFAGYGAEYLELDSQAILEEQRKNFFIPNENVVTIEIDSQEDVDTGEISYNIEIQTEQDAFQFLFLHLNVTKANQLLSQNLNHLLR